MQGRFFSLCSQPENTTLKLWEIWENQQQVRLHQLQEPFSPDCDSVLISQCIIITYYK